MVLDCRPEPAALPPGLDPDDAPRPVGPRPGKTIDPLLTGANRAIVLGTDADLAAVTVRLLRKDLLGSVTVGFLPTAPGHVARLWGLPNDPAARADTARNAAPAPTPLVRDDAGGVLIGRGELSPIHATVYVDAALVLRGAASSVQVEPDPDHGVAVAVRHRRLLGIGHRETVTRGRAVQFGLRPGSTIVRDGEMFPRPMDRWTFYRHTAPMWVARPR